MCAFERAEDTLRRLAMMRRFLIALVLVLFSGGVCGIELSKMRPKLSFGIAAQSAAMIAALVAGNGFDAGHQAQLCPCSTCIAGSIGLAPIAVARAANLPESNGASSSMRGTRAALAGIRKIGDLAGRAKGEENDFVALKLTLAEFPSTEKAFKKLRKPIFEAFPNPRLVGNSGPKRHQNLSKTRQVGKKDIKGMQNTTT